MGKKASSIFGSVPAEALLQRTSKAPKQGYIAQRCKGVTGRKVATAVGLVFDGRTYSMGDLRYDIARGYLIAKRVKSI